MNFSEPEEVVARHARSHFFATGASLPAGELEPVPGSPMDIWVESEQQLARRGRRSETQNFRRTVMIAGLQALEEAGVDLARVQPALLGSAKDRRSWALEALE